MDFILTLNRENGAWDETKISTPNKNGTRDYGICQVNSAYHLPFINSPDFKDWQKQIDYCWNLYAGFKAKGIIGKRFYGFNTRLKDRDKFFYSTITPKQDLKLLLTFQVKRLTWAI